MAVKTETERHNVVDRGVLQAGDVGGKLAGKVEHRDQLIIC